MNAEHFLRYIKQSYIPEKIKCTLSDITKSNKNSVYLYYPKLFAEAFSLYKHPKVDLLCVAANLYYHSMIYLDSILDENRATPNLLFVLTCHEEAIKILTDIFGKDSIFWSYWNNRKQEHYSATYIDKELYNKKIINAEEYYKLSDYKSAFGKAAIDALHVLSNKKYLKTYSALIQSHKYFSIANQMSDDIKDFKIDYKFKQFNWAYYRLRNHCDIGKDDIETLNKKLYIKGIAIKLSKEAIKLCDQAMDELSLINADLLLWKQVLLREKKGNHMFIIETDNYIKSLEAVKTPSAKKNS